MRWETRTTRDKSPLGKPRPLSWPVLILAGGLWVGVLATGFLVLGREEFTPARNAPRLGMFPHDSAVALASHVPTLLLFAHPQCPCTRASLHELDRLLGETEGKVSVTIVFTIPAGVPPDWEKGDLWTLANSIQGIRIFRDQDGAEATRFGVDGSGHVLLYSPSGELLFSGGITSSRGHEGDNPGRSAVESLVLSGHSSVRRTPVFGCSLL